MKILYLVSSLKRSGPTIQLLSLVKYLPKEEIDVHIISLNGEGPKSMKDDFIDLGATIYEMSPKSKLNFSFKDSLSIINELKPDLVHSSGIKADFLASRLDVTTVSTIHNYMPLDYYYRFGYLKGLLLTEFHLRLLNKVDHPIACSSSIAKLYEREKRISFEHIRNGIDIDKFSPLDSKEIKDLRKKLKLPLGKKIIISTGEISKLKDTEIICQSFSKSELKEKFLLLFLGDGNEREYLQKKYNVDSIIFKGQVRNVDEYLKASDVFISASHTEGMPNAVIEAFSSNLFIILSDISQHKEIVNYGGDYQLFKVGDSEDLVEKLNDIQSKNFSENSNYLIANKYFTAEEMSRKYFEKYLEYLVKV